MVPTCGSNRTRQSLVQQPQQLGAPTVDATECGCSGPASRSTAVAPGHRSTTAAWPLAVCMQPWPQKWWSSLKIEREAGPELVSQTGASVSYFFNLPKPLPYLELGVSK